MSNKSGIHIKKSHEEEFTDFANRMGMSVQEAAAHVLAHKRDYPAFRVEQANFARNASKFHHGK